VSEGFKVGDKVRLTGSGWDGQEAPAQGTVVSIEDVNPLDGFGIFFSGGIEWCVNPYDMTWGGVVVTDEEPDPEPENSFATKVWAILDEIGDLLISKNEAYGDAALNPIRVFSKADTLEQLRVRIDDKLNRIQNGHEYANEDTVDDLIGYLVLYKVGSRG